MRILIIASLSLLCSCAEFNAIINTYGAGASERALESAEWTICTASPVGAVRARYASRAKEWREFCNEPEFQP